MTATTIWSWIVTIVGLLGFILAGRKIWWAWYVNIGCQALWVTFALVSHIYAFLLSAAVYTVVFTHNAIKWTRDRNTSYSNQPIGSLTGISIDPQGMRTEFVIDKEEYAKKMRNAWDDSKYLKDR